MPLSSFERSLRISCSRCRTRLRKAYRALLDMENAADTIVDGALLDQERVEQREPARAQRSFQTAPDARQLVARVEPVLERGLVTPELEQVARARRLRPRTATAAAQDARRFASRDEADEVLQRQPTRRAPAPQHRGVVVEEQEQHVLHQVQHLGALERAPLDAPMLRARPAHPVMHRGRQPADELARSRRLAVDGGAHELSIGVIGHRIPPPRLGLCFPSVGYWRRGGGILRGHVAKVLAESRAACRGDGRRAALADRHHPLTARPG